MKLVDFTTPALEIILPPDLLWEDEFSYTPVESAKSWGVGGSLIMQRGTRLVGRPITLRSPDSQSGWIYRPELSALYAWSADATKKMRLYLELPTDTRDFVVEFDAGTPVEVQAVKGWKDHTDVEPHTVRIKLLTVA